MIVQGISEAAKDYGDAGFRVVILYGVTENGACTCHKGSDCPNPGKHPRLNGWPEAATADPVDIETQFNAYPESNVGVRLGPTSGIVDVEFDCDEGKETARELLSDIETPTYTSARSTHRIFRYPDGLAIDKAVVKARGLEMRFGIEERGSQSVFPPSRHASGVPYQWMQGLSMDDCEFAPFPDCLADLVKSYERPPEPTNGQMVFTMQDDSETLENAMGAGLGERNARLCQLVGRHLSRNGPDEQLLPLALAWNQRCSPPKDEAEITKSVLALAEREMEKASGTAAQRQRVCVALTPVMKLQTRRFSKIEAKPVEWLWSQRIALGKLSLLAGEPGLGKTFLSCDIMSRLSNGGLWPDGSFCPQCESAILTAEDGANDTIRPRLDAHGANVDFIHHIDGVGTDGNLLMPNLSDNLLQIDEWLNEHPNVRLLVIDPLSAFYGGKADTHKDASVRAVLGPVSNLADERNIAILGIAHLNKGQGKSVNRVNGSIGIVAASRAAWLISKDPDDEDSDRRLMLEVKNNLGKANGLAYAIQDGRCVWEDGEVTISADEVGCSFETSPRDEAIDWLQTRLADGPVEVKKLKKEASVDGIAERTLKRAKKELGVTSSREGGTADSGFWVWELPHKFKVGSMTF
ncbi:AAA family ATPase [Planctomycetota bacterium]